MSQLIRVPVDTVVGLTAERAVELLTRLLNAESTYAKLNPAVVTISKRLTVADGGIDAEVNAPPDSNLPADCFFAAGLTGIQLKTGSAFKPWTESAIRDELLNSKGNLLPEIVRLTQRRGRYVVVCTGHDLTPQQRNDARERIASVLESVGVLDYHNLIDVLGASQLSVFVERYPGISALLAHDPIQEALVLDEWARDVHMDNIFRPAPAQSELIDQIRVGIEGNAKHIRVLGEPGLGKTRMVMEAVSAPHIAPSVLYINHGSKFGQTSLFRQLLRAGWATPLVLVLDDLSESEMSDIWRNLKTRCGAMKLVTIDHGQDESHDAEILRLQAPHLPDDIIKGILADKVGDLQGVDRWVSICEGSPRVAHAVAENLYANPTDLLKPPATISLWSRFLHGYGVQENIDSRQVDCVAHHLALFSRFGYEDPVSHEATYIAQLIQEIDPTIGWARFQEIVQNLRGRRVLQGSRTLFFVPKALHIFLWKQFWVRYGRGFDFVAIFNSMPPSLHAWFLNKFRFAEGKDAAFVIEDILKPDGVFSNRDMLTSLTGSKFLSTLAEANPAAVMRLLEQSIGKWSDTELFAFQSNRQNIVCALEKIAVWPLFTVRSLNVLVRLAVNENSEFANNSTGTLMSLFRIGPELAATEASPEQRLPALIALLRGESDIERILGLQVLNAALETRGGGFRIVGPEYQGLKQRAKIWVPANRDEWLQAYLLYFKTLIHETEAWPSQLRPKVCSALLHAVEHQIRTPLSTELALQTLEALASDNAMPPSQLNKFFWDWQEYREDKVPRHVKNRIKTIARRYARRDIGSRFQRYVLDVDWLEWEEEYRSQRNKRPSHAKSLVTALARRIVANPDYLDEISHLITAEQHSPALWKFGEQLAVCDKNQIIFPRLFAMTANSSNSTCLLGYLAGVRSQSEEQFESWLIDMLRSSNTARLGVEMTLRSPYAENTFSRCLDALEENWVEAHIFGLLQYGRAMDEIPIEKIVRLFHLIQQRDNPESLRMLIGLMSSLSSARSILIDAEFVSDIVKRAISCLLSPGHSFGYNWKCVSLRLVKSNAEFATPLLDAILTAMGNDYQLSYDDDINSLSEELIAIDPEQAWQVIAKQLEAALPKWRHDLYSWLKGGVFSFGEDFSRGPIAELPEQSILSWIEKYPSERAPFIAHATLPSLDDECGGSLTRQILILYGHIDGVRSGISASFHSGSWIGLASDHLKNQRDIWRRWLTCGFDFRIAQWIESEIEYLDRRIQKEEIDEERDRFE